MFLGRIYFILEDFSQAKIIFERLIEHKDGLMIPPPVHLGNPFKQDIRSFGGAGEYSDGDKKNKECGSVVFHAGLL